MKKFFFATLLASTSYAATAQVVAPAGADLPARISKLTAHAVEVVVVKPEKVNTVWEKIAANMTGCQFTGKRIPSAGGRMSLDFDTLKCEGKPPVAVRAFGVNTVTQRVDLNKQATVGTSLAVLVLENISLPGGPSWERIPR
jgi:hypothetical protein